MCNDYDLFGDVIVTLDDVELWRDKVPKHLSNSPNARIRYAKDYDIARKIKAAKINGTFELLKESDKFETHSDKFLYHPDYLANLRCTKTLHRLAHLLG